MPAAAKILGLAWAPAGPLEIRKAFVTLAKIGAGEMQLSHLDFLPKVSTNFMTKHKTIFDLDFQIVDTDYNFNYQTDLTARLDQQTTAFDQNIINEIVLWKVNRYANIDTNTLQLVNSIDSNATTIDTDNTKKILQELLNTKGIKLPMASTILRFKNKNIYQIIDQRVYRIIYKDKKLKLTQYLNDTNMAMQIELYLQYLKDLADVCKKINIPFDKSDRILFIADRRINKDHKLDNY
jgi:thermostable 8-oxoguanine DNA glycosylase